MTLTIAELATTEGPRQRVIESLGLDVTPRRSKLPSP